MTPEITNCGLIALRNISALESVSIKTLIYMAKDNGIKLYPYKVQLDKIYNVPFPAIFHADNHFIYATNISDLNGYKLTGNILLTQPDKSYKKIPANKLTEVVGGSWAAIVVGVGTTVYGAVKSGQANKKTKEALAKRKAYVTPDELFKILNATEMNAQGDTQTRDYQTGQIDNAFSNQLQVDELLGADPNDLSGLFQQKMNGIIQVGQQFHASNLESFGKYLNALNVVGESKAAEAQSQDNLLKDLLQSLNQKKADANKTIGSGVNLALTGVTSLLSNQLYGDKKDKNNDGTGENAQDTGFNNNYFNNLSLT